MPNRANTDPPTLRLSPLTDLPPPDEIESALTLFAPGGTTLVHLREQRTYVLGRSARADIIVHDTSVSREHVAFEVTDAGVQARDLDSSNGTYLNGERLERPSQLAFGDLLSVGSVHILFESSKRRRTAVVLDRELFEDRLLTELERSARFGHPLTLIVIQHPDGVALEESVVRASAAAARGMDVIGRLAPSTLAILLLEARGEEGVCGAERIIAHLAAIAPEVRAGVANWPDDARDAEGLIEAAHDASVRSESGKLRAVQDEVVEVALGERTAVFSDPATRRLVEIARRLGGTDLPILISGETGAGKEIFARVVHDTSPHAQGPFVSLNCAAVPENLAESELFGHARGAFTGASDERAGKIEQADHGSLFLDEIGEMPLAVQAKLLRVLEDKLVTRLGGDRARPIDVRIVAATNRDLKEEVRSGRFRSDLYYRLSAATLVVPALRDRPRDIPLLARHYVLDMCERLRRPACELSDTALEVLRGYAWPGNVRELRNAMERAVALARSNVIGAEDLPRDVRGDVNEDELEAQFVEETDVLVRPLADQIRELEETQIRKALELSGGIRKRAAEILGMPLRTFHMKLKQYGIR